MTFDDYLRQVVPSKRPLYQLGMNEFLGGAHLSKNFKMMQKDHEWQYTPDVRPRFIANPAPPLKAVMGVINHIYIKHIRKIFPEVAVGLNTG